MKFDSIPNSLINLNKSYEIQSSQFPKYYNYKRKYEIIWNPKSFIWKRVNIFSEKAWERETKDIRQLLEGLCVCYQWGLACSSFCVPGLLTPSRQDTKFENQIKTFPLPSFKQI